MNKNNPQKICFAFFGTDTFSVTVLTELKKVGFIPNLIVTTPDKPQGRKLILTPPAVKEWAASENIEIIQPENLADTETVSELKEKSFDVGIVASYGKIIPKNIIDIFLHGILNVHPSLLPRLRGASPIQTALLTEDSTGVTIMLMDEKMDHGEIIVQEEVPTKEWPLSTPELEDILGHRGGVLLSQTLEPWILGTTQAHPQMHTEATFTKKIKKEDAEINLNNNALENYRRICAYADWPRAYFFTHHNNKTIRVIITKAHLEKELLIIERVIPEGKKEMAYEDFLRGLRN